MVEESNQIFLADSDSVVYFAEPVHKKYSKRFNWGHPFSKHFFISLSPSTYLHTLWMAHSPFLQLRTYLMDGLFLNQKTNNNI